MFILKITFLAPYFKTFISAPVLFVAVWKLFNLHVAPLGNMNPAHFFRFVCSYNWIFFTVASKYLRKSNRYFMLRRNFTIKRDNESYMEKIEEE
jgi:hypothetical protein